MSKEKFEDKMEKLASIVDKLDDENVGLDESIKLYEEGLKLSKELKEQLKVFEDRINDINKGDSNE